MQISPFSLFFLQTPAALVSQLSALSCQHEESTSLLQVSPPVSYPGNSLKAISWSNRSALFIWCPSLRENCPSFLNVQCLANHCFLYFVWFLGCFRQGVNLVHATPSQLEVEAPSLMTNESSQLSSNTISFRQPSRMATDQVKHSCYAPSPTYPTPATMLLSSYQSELLLFICSPPRWR